jgi:hypothetical protein
MTLRRRGLSDRICPKSGTFVERGTIAYAVLTVRKAVAKQLGSLAYIRLKWKSLISTPFLAMVLHS